MKAHAARSEPGMGGRGAMERQGGLAADEAGRAELERLGRSAARREADRARAVLWSLEGETSPTIAAPLGVAGGAGRRVCAPPPRTPRVGRGLAVCAGPPAPPPRPEGDSAGSLCL